MAMAQRTTLDVTVRCIGALLEDNHHLTITDT